jgi:hypothetical protein
MRNQMGDGRGAAAVSLYSKIGRLDRPGLGALVQGDLRSRTPYRRFSGKTLLGAAARNTQESRESKKNPLVFHKNRS